MAAPIAGWAQQIDVSNDAITCNTVLGITSIAPVLVTGGTATSAVMSVKGSVAGCTVTGPNSVLIRSGKVSGKVVATSNECLTLFQSLSGTLTTKWKADKTTPIVPTSSKMSITNVSFGVFAAPWGGWYGQFSLGVGGVTGAFTGGDAGRAREAHDRPRTDHAPVAVRKARRSSTAPDAPGIPLVDRLL